MTPNDPDIKNCTITSPAPRTRSSRNSPTKFELFCNLLFLRKMSHSVTEPGVSFQLTIAIMSVSWHISRLSIVGHVNLTFLQIKTS